MMEELRQDEQSRIAGKMKHPFILAALSGDNSSLFWKYFGGTLIILGSYFVGSIPMAIAMLGLAFMNGVGAEALSDPAVVESLNMDKNLMFFLALLIFVIGDFGIWLVNKYIHKRKFITLITPFGKINWKKILIAFSIYISISAISEGIVYLLNPDNYILQFDAAKFIPLLIITLVVMPFQTSFEELFFRGYLMQGFGLLFKNTTAAVLITSLLFALMHSGNPEVSTFGFWVMFPFYFGFGLMLGFIVIKEKSLEISLAVHAANNMFTSLFITFKGGALQTDAVFIQKEMDPLGMMPYYFASMILFLLICYFVFGWRKDREAVTTA